MPKVASTMARKSDAFDTILDFEAPVKRHFGLTICLFRLDNERSLVNPEHQLASPFELWARDEGIDLAVTPPHTKESNGGAERSAGIISTKGARCESPRTCPRACGQNTGRQPVTCTIGARASVPVWRIRCVEGRITGHGHHFDHGSRSAGRRANCEGELLLGEVLPGHSGASSSHERFTERRLQVPSSPRRRRL